MTQKQITAVGFTGTAGAGATPAFKVGGVWVALHIAPLKVKRVCQKATPVQGIRPVMPLTARKQCGIGNMVWGAMVAAVALPKNDC